MLLEMAFFRILQQPLLPPLDPARLTPQLQDLP